MEKKNRFVFNIGFNQDNPAHLKVADILNRLGHGKAEYLAKAVLFFEENQGGASFSRMEINYKSIEAIVREVLSKEKPDREVPSVASQVPKGNLEEGGQTGIEESDMQYVLQALDCFRSEILI